MAENGAKMDFKAHEQTYEGFIRMFKVGTVCCAVIAAIVILLIAH
jgi:hypothetical protein